MPAPRRPLTDAERALVVALSSCSFPVGSAPKRFARELAGTIAHLGTNATITEAQAGYLRRLVSTYRRQLRPESLPEGERYLLTDGAARAAREERDAAFWVATPGRPVPFWVVRLAGMSTVEAIVAKWGPGARFERPGAPARREPLVPRLSRPRAAAAPPAGQGDLFGGGGR